jgi:predicted membrane protein
MNFKNTEKLNSFLFRLLWKIVSFIPFNFLPRPFGIYTRYYLLVLFGAKFGKDIVINNKVKVYDPRNLYFDDFQPPG